MLVARNDEYSLKILGKCAVSLEMATSSLFGVAGNHSVRTPYISTLILILILSDPELHDKPI